MTVEVRVDVGGEVGDAGIDGQFVHGGQFVGGTSRIGSNCLNRNLRALRELHSRFEDNQTASDCAAIDHKRLYPVQEQSAGERTRCEPRVTSQMRTAPGRWAYRKVVC